MNCELCFEKSSKYKCPTCYINYCSLNCYKTHKTGACVKATVSSQDQTSVTKVKHPTRDTVPEDKLKLLDQNCKLKEILMNPHLRNLLKNIDESGNAQDVMAKAMLEPIFVEFADLCLKDLNQ